jgi:hypothetical protein
MPWAVSEAGLRSETGTRPKAICESSRSPLSHLSLRILLHSRPTAPIPGAGSEHAPDPCAPRHVRILLQTKLCEAQQLFGYLIRRTAKMLIVPKRRVGSQAVATGSMPNTTPLCMNMLLNT